MELVVKVMYPHFDCLHMYLYLPLFQAISIPVVVVVHGIQTSSAEATIFWDNYFAEAVSKLLIRFVFIFFAFRNVSCLMYQTKYHGLCSVKHLATISSSKQDVASMNKTLSTLQRNYEVVRLQSHVVCM